MAEPINVVVDLSHHNCNVDLGQAQSAGIVGVVHKATQGTSFVDPEYATNRAKAKAAGLLWGAYHFGAGADGVEQADFFLKTVQPGPQDLLVLDFEALPFAISPRCILSNPRLGIVTDAGAARREV